MRPANSLQANSHQCLKLTLARYGIQLDGGTRLNMKHQIIIIINKILIILGMKYYQCDFFTSLYNPLPICRLRYWKENQQP